MGCQKDSTTSSTSYKLLCIAYAVCVLVCKCSFKNISVFTVSFCPLLVQVASSFVWTIAIGSGQNRKGDRVSTG